MDPHYRQPGSHYVGVSGLLTKVSAFYCGFGLDIVSRACLVVDIVLLSTDSVHYLQPSSLKTSLLRKLKLFQTGTTGFEVTGVECRQVGWLCAHA